MKMYISDDYYTGICFEEDANGNADVPDEIADRWLRAEKEYHNAQNEAMGYIP